MDHSQHHSDFRLSLGCMTAILLTLGLDTVLVLAIFLIARTYW